MVYKNIKTNQNCVYGKFTHVYKLLLIKYAIWYYLTSSLMSDELVIIDDSMVNSVYRIKINNSIEIFKVIAILIWHFPIITYFM